MTEARFRIRFAGPHVTYQDAGRAGYMRFGVPRSGPMDRLAFTAAHRALGNPEGGTVIEVSAGGLQLDCLSGAVSFALTGGDFLAEVGDRRVAGWSVSWFKAGETLIIRPGHWGNWAVLAFAGEVVAPTWLDSTATHAPSGLGGGILRTGDEVTVAQADLRPERHRDLICPVLARPTPRVTAVYGPQDRFFTDDTLRTFADTPFTMTGAFDRMGARLAGADLTPNGPLDMPSEALIRGSVQVSGDGVATILQADHQTTGGYPKIATVPDYELDRVAQMRPGSRFTFQPISATEAAAKARIHRNAAARYLVGLDHLPER